MRACVCVCACVWCMCVYIHVCVYARVRVCATQREFYIQGVHTETSSKPAPPEFSLLNSLIQFTKFQSHSQIGLCYSQHGAVPNCVCSTVGETGTYLSKDAWEKSRRQQRMQ